MEKYVESCEKMARAAGDVLLDWEGRVSVREKARADLVTEADLASQKLIESLVAAEFPDHGFTGEEASSPISNHGEAEFCWYVDPLDGTTNFVHRLPGWCVSIGLAHHDEMVAGCVFDPIIQNCFTAARGAGAFLNGERIEVSKTENLTDALVAISLPAGVDRRSQEFTAFVDLLERLQAFRRLGSAALNLCYVACGQLDGYWAGRVQPWDVAAGTLIVQEAGGTVTSASGEPFKPTNSSMLCAGSVQLHRAVLDCLREKP